MPRNPTATSLTIHERTRRNERVRRSYEKQAPRYDKAMRFFEHRLLGSEHRNWACSRTTGATLEVAIGTGLNLAHYPADVKLTGIDLSPQMLAIADQRATSLQRAVDLHEGDAHELPFDDATFDSVVCTYSLCNIPDPRLAATEMARVLRQGGNLILVDHIRSSVAPILWLQRAIEFVTARVQDEYLTRRPLEHVQALNLRVTERDRLRAGLIERLTAIRPNSHEPPPHIDD